MDSKKLSLWMAVLLLDPSERRQVKSEILLIQSVEIFFLGFGNGKLLTLKETIRTNCVLIFCPRYVFLEQKHSELSGVSGFLIVALYMPQQLVAFFRDIMDAGDLA